MPEADGGVDALITDCAMAGMAGHAASPEGIEARAMRRQPFRSQDSAGRPAAAPGPMSAR